MKTCPNCGSKMEADVNFCTVCGTNIKDVALDGAAPVQEQPVQPETPTAPVQQSAQPEVQANQATAQPQQAPVQPQQSTQQQAPVQPTQPQQNAGANGQQTSQVNDTFSKISSQVTTAVKNFDKESLWKWFVTSWKTPSAEQNGEKWYGIATLIVEILLFSIGFTHGLKATVMPSVSGGLFSLSGVQSQADSAMSGAGILIFIILMILCAGILAASYFSSKFVHGKITTVRSYVNKVVQLSNLSAILVLVISLLMFFNFAGTAKLTIPLAIFVVLLFLFAAGTEVLNGPRTNRDPFNGVILYIILVAVIVLVIYMVFYQQIASQMPSMGNLF